MQALSSSSTRPEASAAGFCTLQQPVQANFSTSFVVLGGIPRAVTSSKCAISFYVAALGTFAFYVSQLAQPTSTCLTQPLHLPYALLAPALLFRFDLAIMVFWLGFSGVGGDGCVLCALAVRFEQLHINSPRSRPRRPDDSRDPFSVTLIQWYQLLVCSVCPMRMEVQYRHLGRPR